MTAYRWIFGLAALYNAAFGLWAGFFPHSFFALFLPERPPNYPSIWSCLGMVVGVYAIGYAHVAWKPQSGGVLVVIGLLGKVLGPIGWLVAVGRGELPPTTFLLILANDLIWWFPFLFYLLRDVSVQRTIIAWISVVIHVAACFLLMASAGGTEMVPGLSARLGWISEHKILWVTTWMTWTLGSMSLLAFFVVWAGRLLERGVPRTWVVTACLTCAAGVLFDLPGESLNLAWATRPGLSPEEFAWGARAYALLSAATANGLYCVAGLVLSTISWRNGWLRGWIGLLGMVMWTVGLLLTVMAVAGNDQGMIITGAIVMMLYVPWATLVGWRLRPARAKLS